MTKRGQSKAAKRARSLRRRRELTIVQLVSVGTPRKLARDMARMKHPGKKRRTKRGRKK